MKPRNVRGGITNPQGRAIFHQAADESFVRGSELRCAKEGLCTTEEKGLEANIELRYLAFLQEESAMVHLNEGGDRGGAYSRDRFKMVPPGV